MGYGEYLRALLRPMALYQLDEGCGGAELTVLGGQLDQVMASLETCWREGMTMTAVDTGLAAYEALLPFTPAAVGAAERRAAIAALLRIDQASFTPTAMQDTVTGCGIPAVVTEAGATQVNVRFPGVRGTPANLTALQARLGEILPCHVQVNYQYVYTTFAELEDWFADWDAVGALTWTQLSAYTPA